MSLWLQEKYVNLLGPSLRNFKAHRRGQRVLWNFSCPLCGDSKTDPKKARGYIYFKKDGYKFTCHNCGRGHRVEKFLHLQNSALFYEYRKECLALDKSFKPVVIEEEKAEPVFDAFTSLKTIADLDPDHPARQYVAKRQIPKAFYKRLFYAPKFRKFVNSVVPDKFGAEALKFDEPRLIIPYINKDSSIIGFTGRSFDPKAELRYMEISLSDQPRVFGLDRVDLKRPYYVVEGPIDAMFIPNCIAAGGSNIRHVMGELGTAIFDNQPRNKEICKLMEMCIDAGMKIVIWPPNLAGKDINDLVLAGHQIKDILDVISNNSYSGLMAKVKFNEWRRI